MTLRPDVTFHNGTPLTAQTIADMFPIQQAGAAGQSAITGASLASVAAVDDLTVEYTLSAPNVAFPAPWQRRRSGSRSIRPQLLLTPWATAPPRSAPARS